MRLLRNEFWVAFYRTHICSIFRNRSLSRRQFKSFWDDRDSGLTAYALYEPPWPLTKIGASFISHTYGNGPPIYRKCSHPEDLWSILCYSFASPHHSLSRSSICSAIIRFGDRSDESLRGFSACSTTVAFVETDYSEPATTMLGVDCWAFW